jgi:purine-binding chemotaxis protein CheW
VGAKVCGLQLAQVIETMRPLSAEPLAHMPSFVTGLAQIRGRATPVIDARKLLGSPSASAAERYVTLGVDARHGARAVALAVDAVLGVRKLEALTLDSLPGLLSEEHAGLVTAVGVLDAELLLVLEQARLLSEAAWQTLEREAASA